MTGSLTLVGGGWGGDARVWRTFVDDATAYAGDTVPRVAVVTVRDGDEQEHAAKLIADIAGVGAIDPVVVGVAEGTQLDPSRLHGIHGVLVGGGLTPAYLDALAPHAATIRDLVASGVPYAGFSAGSAIAADRALVGGWRDPSGHPVVDEEVAEELIDLTVRQGLGLTPWTVDVHAAQWGTLGRLIAAVDGGLAPDGVAIDEDTAVIVRGGAVAVAGTGNAWWVSRADGGALVRREASA